MADEMVLKAQKWVNATYSGIGGYNPCREDGKTAWSTMYSLTRALQHELGISNKSDSFGPTTMSLLKSRGPIGPGETNKNILKIIQSAFFCKGYHAYDIDGNWRSKALGSGIELALFNMMSDMGLRDSFNNTIHPIVFKALLTMDAYVLIPGGVSDIRTVQQWMNAKFWQKPWGYIIPTEGHFSRNVQQLHLRALQSALGISDSDIADNFGPATQAGLKRNVLSIGSAGLITELYTAACVFNSPTYSSTGEAVYAGFRSQFTEKTAFFTRSFQEFSELLPASGKADYSTWSQLLVSMGDVDRPVTGCDTRFTITPAVAKALYAKGFRIVGRYLDETSTSTLDKEIKVGEIENIFSAGMKIFPIWQYNARELSDFSYDNGLRDGRRAFERMKHYNFKAGAVVYFAVDYDATNEGIDSAIIPYFRGVQSAFNETGRQYKVGVYGSRNVCSRISREVGAVSSFVSGMSWKFSGNLGFPLPHNWAFNQIQELRSLALDGAASPIDLDRVVHRADFDGGVGPNGVGPTLRIEVPDVVAFIDQVYKMAVGYGKGDPNQLTLDYLRHPNYTRVSTGWDLLLNLTDSEWLKLASDKFDADKDRVGQFALGASNAFVNIDHIAAAASGLLIRGFGQGAAVTRGDFAGWGGDVATLFAEWRSNYSIYPSGMEFCRNRFAVPGVPGSFSLGDLLEDSGGFILASRIKSGKNIVSAFSDVYTSPASAVQVSKFFDMRFGTSTQMVADAVRAMLLPTSDSILNDFRDLSIASKSGLLTILPREIPSSELMEFSQGVAARLAHVAKGY